MDGDTNTQQHRPMCGDGFAVAAAAPSAVGITAQVNKGQNHDDFPSTPNPPNWRTLAQAECGGKGAHMTQF